MPDIITEELEFQSTHPEPSLSLVHPTSISLYFGGGYGGQISAVAKEMEADGFNLLPSTLTGTYCTQVYQK